MMHVDRRWSLVVTATLAGCIARPAGEDETTDEGSTTATTADATGPMTGPVTSVETTTETTTGADETTNDDSLDGPICLGFCDLGPFPDMSQCLPPSGSVWIAQPTENTVTKIATDTQVVLGRYSAPPGGSALATAVSLDGHAAVATAGGGVMMVRGQGCDDAASSSTGWDDVYPFGDDGCLGWATPLDGSTTTVAWSRGEWNELDCTWAGTYVWATVDHGGGLPAQVVILDGQDGEVLASAFPLEGRPPSPESPIDGIADADGDFWFIQGSELVQVDSLTLMGTVVELPATAAAITLDAQSRPWVSAGEAVYRYDPSIAMLDEITLGTPGATTGLASDGEQTMWVTQGSGLVGIDLRTLVIEAQWMLDHPAHGVGMDDMGFLWLVSPQNTLGVVHARSGMQDWITLEAEHAGRSDFSGSALQLVSGR